MSKGFLKKYFDRYSPKTRQYITLGGVGALVLSAVYLGVSSQEQEYTGNRDNVIRNVLTDKNTREITLDTMAAEMKHISSEILKLRRDFDALKSDVDRKDYNAGAKIDPQVLNNQLKALSDQINRQKEQIRQIEGRRYGSMGFDNTTTVLDGVTDFGRDREQQGDVSQAEVAQIGNDQNKANSEIEREGREKNQNFEDFEDFKTIERRDYQIPVFTVTSGTSKQQELAHKVPKMKEYSVYLPAGSILTGVLLNGIDAPTGQQARKEPFPAVVRIQKEAILPNYNISDIRECFLIVSGYGDLSSERAYLRGETLSCIDSNKNFIEGGLHAYAVGDDGKAGIRGRLVSKQGQIIAKSLMAGFLSGLADVFDVDAVPTINTSSTGKVSYEHVYSASALQGAATKGISSSLEKIADFYIKIAEGLYPVIEIDGGRSIDLVVSQGSEITLRNNSDSKDTSDRKKDSKKETVGRWSK